MISNKKQVLIFGSTGQLGQLIAKHCFNQPSLQVNILVRNPDKNKELCQKVVDLGGKVIIGDATKPETLKDSTIGIHTIISSLIGDDSTVLEGQRALLRDAVKNGVQRFLPSDFSCDYKKLQVSEHPMLGQRIQFKQDIAQTNVKGIHIFNGAFMETFWWGFAKKNEQGGVNFNVWGNGDIKLDITTYEDTAKFVAAVVSDPNSAGDYEIIGSSNSMNEISEIYKKVKGKPSNVSVNGTVQELINLRDNHPTKEGWPYLYLCYQVPMYDGRGKLHNPQNEKYGIKATTHEEFLKNRPDL